MTSTTRHKEARELATQAFLEVLGRPPSLTEVQCLQAIGGLETSYGYGWKASGAVGSNNIGAIIAGSSWKGETFVHGDTRPDPANPGKNISYVTEFRKYPTPLDGWKDLVKVMYVNRPSVLKAATAGDVFGVSAALYDTKYFFGTGATIKQRIERHHTAVMRNLVAQVQAFAEPMPEGFEVPRRTLRVGMVGEDVKDLQRALSLVADGVFGPATELAVFDLQANFGLTQDGVVGEKTWKIVDKLIELEATDISFAIREALRNTGK
jgi:peptidoglycan hydrolase-like protein with peptidoglycan-binding domain